MNIPIRRVPYSKFYWYWLRQWQKKVNLSDVDLAACLKVGMKTLKTYDETPHSFNLDKLDNLVSAFGTEPLIYITENAVVAYNNTRNYSESHYSEAPYTPQKNSLTLEEVYASSIR